MRLLASFLSLIMAGLGHVVAGHAARGAVWLAAQTVLVLLTPVVGAFWLPGVLVVGGGALFLEVVCAVDAFFIASTQGAHSVKAWAVYGGLFCFSFVVPVVPVVVALIAHAYCIEALSVGHAGSCPTVQVGDRVFADKTAFRFEPPKRGDFVVYAKGDADFLGRVVAIGGDEVRFDGSRLFSNGREAPRRFLGQNVCNGMDHYEETLGSTYEIALTPGDPSRFQMTAAVPDGQLFIVGDNRDNSYDSRETGTISVDAVRGRVRWRWYRENMQDSQLGLAEIR